MPFHSSATLNWFEKCITQKKKGQPNLCFIYKYTLFGILCTKWVQKTSLIYIPETVHPQKSVEPFGKEATTFIRNLLLGESVYLRFDSNKTDRYDRLLAYLYRAPDGLFVNLEIVRQGYGKVYTPFPFKHKALFQHYGGQAQQARRER